MPVRDDLADGVRAAAIPEVAGVLTAGQVLATGRSVAAMQQPSGAIGWPDGHVDAWNHVECAMALSVCGLTKPARRAYRWLAATQRPDGAWPREITGERVTNGDTESNQAAYAAVGVWHELQVTGDEEFARAMWPVVHRAITFTLDLRTTRGEIRWKRAADGTVADFALLAGSASIHQSLRCATALAEFMGEPQPEWELAADQLAHVIAAHPEAFADKSRFSMDWYYPVLGGAVRGPAAAGRLAESWDVFVQPGLGARCVSDQPWVTGAETCELVLALDALGDRDTALALFGDVQHLRCEDGSYWTGWQFANQAHYPNERSSWTAAAIVLAADALSGATGGAALFRDAGAATASPVDPAACGCAG